ncbi:MAG: hypothetical protein PF503_13915 [Desulfobacula sp.]|jgi:hypothetical protein|nr:hypothetical protein [Desulfobacula sp.]
MKECKLCLLPAKVPDSDIDQSGICRFCREYEQLDSDKDEFLRKERQEDLEKALKECRNQGEYDCLVPLSGGKDSIYLLYKLKVEYNLKILAFTTNVNIPEIAWDNMKRALKKLDIDHLSYTPSNNLYTKVFKYLLQNQEERGAVYTISYVYAPLFEGDAIKVAMEKNIPLILAGYSPGQPEPERMLYEFSRKLICETDWTPPGLRDSGLLSDKELLSFLNPLSYPPGTEFPRYLAPFHAWEYNQDEVMKSVVKNKLVKTTKHASPIYSNYPINWLLMYSDLKHFGYNPYHPEFSALIREGKAKRLYWKIMTPIVNFMIKNKVLLGKDVTKSLAWLDLDEKDLKINMPKGKYDPVF